MKFYLAFSIHGTAKFKVVTKEASNLEALGPGFTIVESRRPNYNPATDGVKVHWDKMKRRDGQPIGSVSQMNLRFKQLREAGWTQQKPRNIAQEQRDLLKKSRF